MSRPTGILYALNLSNLKGISAKWKEATQYIKWKRKFAPRLKAFKNIHKGQDCFIIGNGPSLKNMDLNLLQPYHTFGLNKFFLMKDLGIELDPSYVVAVNGLVIEQSKEEYEKGMGCPIFLSHTASDGVIENRGFIHRLHTLNIWSFYEDISEPIHEGMTVTFVAMQIAYYMGFERVFLIGVDHSFKQSGKSHETQVYQGEDLNHFHPDYFKGQKWQLADVEGSEVSYHMANYFYKKDNRLILDATLGGKLEVFPKISFEDALKMARKKV
jgi:hypothetical protein